MPAATSASACESACKERAARRRPKQPGISRVRGFHQAALWRDCMVTGPDGQPAWEFHQDRPPDDLGEMVRDAVRSEPVSPQISLLNRESTGKSLFLGLCTRARPLKKPQRITVNGSKFPGRGTGNSRARYREFNSPNSERALEKQANVIKGQAIKYSRFGRRSVGLDKQARLPEPDGAMQFCHRSFCD